MNTAYLLLGSNLGDRLSYIYQAKRLITSECGNITIESGIYETAAWGITEQPSFYNQVVVLQTELAPSLLMQTLLTIEEKIGRKRIIKYGPRIIDIDILLADSLIINTPLLITPHPFLQKRRFALLPLALGLGTGAEMLQPLAIALIFGLVIQIPLVLVLLPCLLQQLHKLDHVNV